MGGGLLKSTMTGAPTSWRPGGGLLKSTTGGAWPAITGGGWE